MMMLNVGTGQHVFSVPADVGIERSARKTGGNKAEHLMHVHLTKNNIHVTGQMGNDKSQSERKKLVEGKQEPVSRAR